MLLTIAATLLLAVLHSRCILSDFLTSNHPIACPTQTEYDYIVVGGGSSGGILASRLSEDGSSVLILEAGRIPDPLDDIPLLAGTFPNQKELWLQYTVPQKNCCQIFKNNSSFLTLARSLGGGSSDNAMIYGRGNRNDYDNWANMTMDPNWSYDGVLPFFLKLEDWQIPTTVHDAPYHNKGGPITVTWPSFKTPMADAFQEGGMQLDYPLTDIIAEHQYGFTFPPHNMKNGKRCGVYQAYILPASNRSNLKIATNAFVTKVNINPTTMVATGVEFEWGDPSLLGTYLKCRVTAKKDISLNAGTLSTPKILMQSGIGPKETLQKFQIPVIKDLPGVGIGLTDQVSYFRAAITVKEDVDFNLVKYTGPQYLAQYIRSSTGPYTSVVTVEGQGYINTTFNTKDWPDIEFLYASGDFFTSYFPYFSPNFVASYGYQFLTLLPRVSIGVQLMRPRSRGYVTLASANPRDDLIVDPNLLADSDDVKALIEGVKRVEQLVKTPSFARYGAEIIPYGPVPGCETEPAGTDRFYQCLVKAYTLAFSDPTSTCRMTQDSDPMGVVDTRLRVRGVKNLRVADGSMFPQITTGHTNVPCMMLGEKAAAIIKEDHSDSGK